MKTMETKKFYVIASTEYKANMPDMFVMDEEGNYYGVAGASYAKSDELLRFKQLSGLAELFKDREYSKATEL